MLRPLMWKAAPVCFLMTLQHIGIEFSHRAETDGRASWCMANWEMKTCMLRNGSVYFLSGNVTTYGTFGTEERGNFHSLSTYMKK